MNESDIHAFVESPTSLGFIFTNAPVKKVIIRFPVLFIEAWLTAAPLNEIIICVVPLSVKTQANPAGKLVIIR